MYLDASAIPNSHLMMGPAEDAAGVESVIGEDARGEITGFAHLADSEHRLACVDLAQTPAQLGKRDILGTRHGTFCRDGRRVTSMICSPALARSGTGRSSPSRMLPAANPATLMTSLALPNGGA